jgi:aspartate aminotransferase-like enzyme
MRDCFSITYKTNRPPNQEDALNKQLLFIPGPVTVAEPVLAAMAKPMVDHRGPEFKALLNHVAEKLKPIFGTRHDVVILGASGTGGLEAAVTSCFGPGDTVLACPVGVFGERIRAIAETYGITVETLPTEFGYGVDPAALKARLAADVEKKIAGIMLTHNETSTGVQNDMAALAEAIRGHGAIVVVDSVSGLAASAFHMDAWGFDVVVTASQKALAVPPGAAMVAVSPRAWEKIGANPGPRYYFGLAKAREFAKLGQTPWTPPISILYALDVALDRYNAEGAEAFQARHDRYARAIRAAAEELGMPVFSHDGAHSVTVVAMRAPAGIDVDAMRKALREEHGYVFGGGQKQLKGKLVRMGTMGDLSQTDILAGIGALETALLARGAAIHAGRAAQAALGVLLADAEAVAL